MSRGKDPTWFQPLEIASAHCFLATFRAAFPTKIY